MKQKERMWFQMFFDFYPYLGMIPILTNIFQLGWNHQLGKKTSLLKLPMVSVNTLVFQSLRTSGSVLWLAPCVPFRMAFSQGLPGYVSFERVHSSLSFAIFWWNTPFAGIAQNPITSLHVSVQLIPHLAFGFIHTVNMYTVLYLYIQDVCIFYIYIYLFFYFRGRFYIP